jgi:ribosomal protein L18
MAKEERETRVQVRHTFIHRHMYAQRCSHTRINAHTYTHAYTHARTHAAIEGGGGNTGVAAQ